MGLVFLYKIGEIQNTSAQEQMLLCPIPIHHLIDMLMSRYNNKNEGWYQDFHDTRSVFKNGELGSEGPIRIQCLLGGIGLLHSATCSHDYLKKYELLIIKDGLVGHT